ncbi:MAG: acetate/propionate family kinase [Methylococcales bacterium]|nr:acetate/propionate family kinase [Methylococcales bacterium]
MAELVIERVILVINAGSSSVKYQLLSLPSGKVWLDGQISGLGAANCQHRYQSGASVHETAMPDADHAAALTALFDLWSQRSLPVPVAVGHRVVHGGEVFTQPTRMNAENLARLEALDRLAPLHNPVNRLGIVIAHQYFSDIPHLAVFDTAFHATLPDMAFRYAVPEAWYQQYGIRRYGFHGTAHAAALAQVSAYLNQPRQALNLITLQLGNGASACAIQQGRSVDTSMGFTPLEGLVMGTRCGDLDPAIPGHLMRLAELSADVVDHQLNHGSGLQGLCGDADMRRVCARAMQQDEEAERALAVYCYRVQKYIGAYWAVMGGIDALVFSGGVGEHSAMLRARICAPLAHLGVAVDARRNAQTLASVAEINPPDRPGAKVLVVQVDEQRAIAEAVQDWLLA